MKFEMEEYIGILEGQEKADSTIDNCRRGLEQFSAWIDEEGLAIEEVTPRDIQRWST